MSYPTFTWEINEFSTYGDDAYNSGLFSGGANKWMLLICPKGEGDEWGKSLKFILWRAGSYETQSAVYARYKLRVLDQLNDEHYEKTCGNWFFPWMEGAHVSFTNFMSLEDLHKPSNGFIVKDTLIVEVEFLVVSETKVVSKLKIEKSNLSQVKNELEN